MCEVITFFDKKKEYRCLSNFWEGEVSIKDGDEVFVYLSGELCFHGEKYRRLSKVCNDEDRKNVLLEYSKRFLISGDIKTNKEAKMRGGKGKNGLMLNKDEIKIWYVLSEDVQNEICRYKLENYEEVKDNLKRSSNCFLVHPALRCGNEKMKDKIWEGRIIVKDNGEYELLGGNKLGNIWMELRKEIM